jgi:acyl carrier protein
MSADISDRVRAIAADLFLVPLDQVRADSSPDTIENWDSMQHLNLIVDLEMTFGIKFTTTELHAMNTIASAAAIVQNKLSKTGVA